MTGQLHDGEWELMPPTYPDKSLAELLVDDIDKQAAGIRDDDTCIQHKLGGFEIVFDHPDDRDFSSAKVVARIHVKVEGEEFIVPCTKGDLLEAVKALQPFAVKGCAVIDGAEIKFSNPGAIVGLQQKLMQYAGAAHARELELGACSSGGSRHSQRYNEPVKIPVRTPGTP